MCWRLGTIGIGKTMSGNSIAAIVGAQTSVIQRLLMQAADRWRGEGLRVCGVVEVVVSDEVRACGSSVLRNIETGETFEMYLKEAPAHTSCVLDEVGLIEACASIVGSIQASDVVILSKFGKAEAVGSGLFDAFELASSLGKPTITSVAPKFHYFWNRFAADATFLRPEEIQLEDWKNALLGQRATALA